MLVVNRFEGIFCFPFLLWIVKQCIKNRAPQFSLPSTNNYRTQPFNQQPAFLSPPKHRSLQYQYVYPSSQGEKGYQLCSGAPPLLLAGIFNYPANPSATKSGAFAGSYLGSLLVETCRHLANRLRVDVTQLGGRII